ncbi:DUF2971 domain-containing protein [Aeromonas veronii]|uniref:DUF2971 domain-containing protein n=1 Tax=Aeromonas veronii TaxID=654 RepID=UPI0019202B08|nr:DUF2971 domain-containing protein [Aeromonas veronii]MBL0476330.1 DUF2971 domain-containing protein [Aeromonas veronii]
MDILYKYTSKLNNFITSPTIKLSVPSFLNDPFESYVPKELSKRIPSEEQWLAEIDCNEIIDKLGIVSFSETSRNLLMWAHYADEHRGMCIGFDPEVLNSLDKYEEERSCLAYYPVKLNYDNQRVDINELPAELSLDMVAKKILTTKSDDWIYEKEHRCIVPIGWSNQAFLLGENERVEHAIALMGATRNIKTNEITAEQYKNLIFEELTYYKGMLFLKKINSKMVKSIHFGYRYPLESLLKIVDEISNPTHDLHHIKIFKYTPDKHRFELDAKTIYVDGKSFTDQLLLTMSDTEIR